MQPAFSSIAIFRRSVTTLCKKERLGYHSCRKDICEAFKNRSFEDIWEMKVRLREMGNVRVIKIRIPNSCQNLSASDAFRLIVICNKKYGTVTFLNIYPKRGKLGQLNQSKEDSERQVESYALDLKCGNLISHDLKDDLKEI